MIVLDASAAVEWVLGTPRAAAVEAAAGHSGPVHAPEIFDLEVIQTVRRWIRTRGLPLARAAQAVSDAAELPVDRHSHAGLLVRVWDLRDRCSAYDASYVALAQACDAELVTADAKLAAGVRDLVRVRLV